MDDNQQTTNETTEETKRTRISPRVKFGDEVVAMLAATISSLSGETEGASKATKAKLEAQIEALSDCKNRVEAMMAEGPTVAGYSGRHYLGVLQSGERVAFDSNTVPTVRSHGTESKHAFISVLGSFKTQAGVEYRRTHTDVECPIVF
jgi:hypothetical protein